MKIRRVKTWKARPATMILSPVLTLLFWWEATDAMPPPVAWSNKEKKSQGMNWREMGLASKA
jgi:hypothetical protein